MEDSAASPGFETPPAQEAAAQHLANIIFLSYRFSQGGIGTQPEIRIASCSQSAGIGDR